MRRWLQPVPDPPENVRLAYLDGTESAPLPLRYGGRIQGIHNWLADVPGSDWRPIAGVRISVMPARTVVLLVFDDEEQ